LTKGPNDKVGLITGGGFGIGRATARAAALGALPALYAVTIRSMLRRKFNRLNTGDVGPLLGLYAEDIRLVLFGRHSWSGDSRGKDEVERWMRRLVRVGVRLAAHEILVTDRHRTRQSACCSPTG
jgi:NAD(P)-dependent dehydrogenase (short-subunit alcohol dehydrogenase family)